MDTKTLTINISTPEKIKARFLSATSGSASKTPELTFVSAEAMARTLTPGRWQIIEAMTGAGALGVRELARRVGRDVKGVHSDAQALVQAGVIDKDQKGKIIFPYNEVKVEFTLLPLQHVG